MLKKSKDPLGYTREEITEICREKNICHKKFWEAFEVNTARVGKDGKPRFFKWDIERALYELNDKDGVYSEWD